MTGTLEQKALDKIQADFDDAKLKQMVELVSAKKEHQRNLELTEESITLLESVKTLEEAAEKGVHIYMPKERERY